MTIRFTCDCGQPIAARADYAGRRVQCLACKKVLTVPGQRRATTLAQRTAPKTVLRGPVEGAPATPLSRRVSGVRFRCACGAEYWSRSGFPA
ncbi:MAG: hypothetical protein HYS12_24050 [Planctomycetes bacterium]|nr:hypothetical protein [Planctomycetota bacterium]